MAGNGGAAGVRRGFRGRQRSVIGLAAMGWLGALGFAVSAAVPGAQGPVSVARTQGPVTSASAPPLFDTSHNCMACHNGLVTSSGEDISFGVAWRATMMANSARDPYWQAAVRREIMDHPSAAADIENECSICHMPMAHTQAMATGRPGEIFAHLPVGQAASPEALLAADGVSCTVCHQITRDRFGTPESFTGRFVIATTTPAAGRPLFGPFPVATGLAGLMHSATGFVPVESSHVRESELCATCHTLYTHPLDTNGKALDLAFPEQVPYLEWRHSAFRETRSCQSCHMPVVQEPARMSSVLGELREGIARHSFRGGNFFMLGMLNRYRADLGVEAQPQELEAAVRETLAHLATESATLSVVQTRREDGRLVVDLAVENLSGHKLPTAYPSRRAWIHFTVRNAAGAVFESGARLPDGRIGGNDNDDDGRRFERHYREIRRTDEVQIYEAIMTDSDGAVTTGLLKATSYVKDNRLLPRGFDKGTAHRDIAVYGGAREDSDFTASSDRIRYSIDTSGASGPFVIEAVLRFQPIAFRWAKNLEAYDAPEPRRFVGYYKSMAGSSSAVLARVVAESR